MALAFLDKTPILASSPVRWSLTHGVEPVVQDFEVAAADGELFKKREPSEPISLFIGTGEGDPLEFKFLYVIGVFPGPNPFISRVRVADRRIFWKYHHAQRKYNMRRQVGIWRATNPTTTELQPIEKNLWYWEWSLFSGQPWTALQVLNDLLADACSHEYAYSGAAFIVRNNTPKAGVSAMPVDSWEFSEKSDAAIRRVLAMMPDVTISLTKDGDVKIKQRSADRDEAELIAQLGPEVTEGQDVQYVDTPFDIPQAINVYFTREVEVRFDLRESTTVNGAITTEGTGSDLLVNTSARYLDNVITTPDWQLTYNGKIYPQGSIMKFSNYLDSIPNIPGAGRKLNYKDLRRALAPGGDLFHLILLPFNQDIAAENDDWSSRIGAIKENFRLTFQINRQWVDRCLSIGAYWIATINPESGSRSRAIVYANYAVIPDKRRRLKYSLLGEKDPYVENIEGWKETIDDTVQATPCEVKITDPDQGLLRLEFKSRYERHAKALLPSMLWSPVYGSFAQTGIAETIKGGPRIRSVIGFNLVNARAAKDSDIPELAADHKLAVILTCIPAGPNDVRQFHKITITPQDIIDAFPNSSNAATSLANAKGPIKEMYVSPNVETARIRHLDSRVNDINSLFGFSRSADALALFENAASVFLSQEDADFGSDAAQSNPNEVANVDDLCVNLGPQNAIPAEMASLNAIAKAVAIRQYAKVLGRMHGGMAGNFAPLAEPGGWCDSVEHVVMPDGAVLTMAQFVEKVPEFDFLPYLEPATRKVVLHQISRRS